MAMLRRVFNQSGYDNDFQAAMSQEAYSACLIDYGLKVSDIESGHFVADLDSMQPLLGLQVSAEVRPLLEALLSQLLNWPPALSWPEFVDYFNGYLTAWIHAYHAGISPAIGLTLSRAVSAKTEAGLALGNYSLLAMSLLATVTSRYDQHRLQYYTHHHPHTGLPKLDLLREHLQLCIVQKRNISLMYVAIQSAPSIQSTHELEDAGVLQETAALLQENLAGNCHIYQLQGNRYALLLTEPHQAVQVDLVAAKLMRIFEATLHANNKLYLLRPYVGCVCHPDLSVNVDALCQQAQLTLNDAFKNTQHVAHYSSHLVQNALDQGQLENVVLRAFEDGRFELHIQPIVDGEETDCTYAEVLLRCKHEGGYIPPPLIIEVLYRHGLGERFLRWLLGTACRLAGEVRATLGHSIRLSVNLAAEDLISKELPELLAQSLDLWSIEASCITLEITENGLLLDEMAASATIQELINMGCSIALDDFGTGYSSMTRLRSMPIDIIKIDQSFVHNIHESSEDLEIVRAVIMLARSLGKVVVAEGVEDAQTLDILNELGCKKIQGYYYSKALDVKQFIGWAIRFKK